MQSTIGKRSWRQSDPIIDGLEDHEKRLLELEAFRDMAQRWVWRVAEMSALGLVLLANIGKERTIEIMAALIKALP